MGNRQGAVEIEVACIVPAVGKEQQRLGPLDPVEVVQGIDEAIVDGSATTRAQPRESTRELTGIIGELHFHPGVGVESHQCDSIPRLQDLIHESAGGLGYSRQAFLHRGRCVDQQGCVNRQISHILESADLLRLIVLPDFEVFPIQIENRPAAASCDRGVELDELHIQTLEVLWCIDEDRILGGVAVRQIPHHPQVRQLRVL